MLFNVGSVDIEVENQIGQAGQAKYQAIAPNDLNE
jgi:hypothetical protein